MSHEALEYPEAQLVGSGKPMLLDPLSGVPAFASAWLQVYAVRNCRPCEKRFSSFAEPAA